MIGIFDSGVGGLTVLRALRDVLPSSDVVYYGDTKHAPYGPKSREEITLLTIAAIGELARHGATSVLSACNSVSASLAVSLFDAAALPHDRLIEMVGPTVSALRDRDRILLAATEATIRSEIYQNAFRMTGKYIATVSIPELAGAIERGAEEEERDRIVRDALAGTDPESFDTLVLACTHYPIALSSFTKLFPGKDIVNPASAVAARVERDWWPREAGDGSTRFLITQESAVFRGFAAKLFPDSAYTVEVLE